MDVRKAGHQPAAYADSRPKARPAGKSNTKLIVSIVAVIVVVAVFVTAAWALWVKNDGGFTASVAVKKDQYQAVFLTNGQVYFGKLKNTSGDYLTLKDIYYLQVDSAIQPSTKNGDVTTKSTDSNSNVQLIKLGNELHGPEDEMQVSKEQVLFWENLTNDGKVSKAIASYKQK